MSPRPRRRATRRCRSGRTIESLIFDQHGAVVGLRLRRQQHGWTCSQPLEISVCSFLLNNSMSSLPIVETQKSRLGFCGNTTSLSGIFHPAWCAHLKPTLISSLMRMIDHLTCDHTEVFPLSNKCFLAKCLNTASRCSASSPSDLLLASSSLHGVRPSGPPCLLV